MFPGTADPGGANSGLLRNVIRSVTPCAGIEGNGGIAPLPSATIVRTPSAPSRSTAVSIAGPRSPLRSGPWQTWQVAHKRYGRSSPAAGPIRRPAARALPSGRLGIRLPSFAAVDSPAGTILRIDGTFLVSMKTMPLAASAPLPKKAAPPVTLGNCMVSVRAGGV